MHKLLFMYIERETCRNRLERTVDDETLAMPTINYKDKVSLISASNNQITRSFVVM